MEDDDLQAERLDAHGQLSTLLRVASLVIPEQKLQSFVKVMEVFERVLRTLDSTPGNPTAAYKLFSAKYALYVNSWQEFRNTDELHNVVDACSISEAHEIRVSLREYHCNMNWKTPRSSDRK